MPEVKFWRERKKKGVTNQKVSLYSNAKYQSLTYVYVYNEDNAGDVHYHVLFPRVFVYTQYNKL